MVRISHYAKRENSGVGPTFGSWAFPVSRKPLPLRSRSCLGSGTSSPQRRPTHEFCDQKRASERDTGFYLALPIEVMYSRRIDMNMDVVEVIYPVEKGQSGIFGDLVTIGDAQSPIDLQL